MRQISAVSLCVAALALLPARDVAACGGCFNNIQQMESSVVTGHRMILSISKTQTTLWDQFEYSGAPQDFAWVLPIKGQVDYDVSSDALFASLEQRTAITINSPNINCPPLYGCGFSSSSSGSSGGGVSSGSGVVVIAEKTVGPFDVKELSSADPLALTTWLTTNGYGIPADITPLIGTYISEGFNFLAVRLSADPSVSTHSMKPFRVTTQGGTPVLPLRMVAAGSAATIPITLWVVSEGAYVPANFPYFYIRLAELVWDWDTSSSNYKALRQAGYDKEQGRAWLVEASEAISKFDVISGLQSVVGSDPVNSGYGDDKGVGAQMAFDADMAALFGGIADGSEWLGRIRAELPRSALGDDLQMMASPNQALVNRNFDVYQTKGTPPKCPSCPDSSSSSSGTGGTGGTGGAGELNPGGGCSGACTIGSAQGNASLVGVGALALMAMAGFSRRIRGQRKRTEQTSASSKAME